MSLIAIALLILYCACSLVSFIIGSVGSVEDKDTEHFLPERITLGMFIFPTYWLGRAIVITIHYPASRKP